MISREPRFARRLLLPLVLTLVPLAHDSDPGIAQLSDPEGLAPAKVSREQFLGMRWLEGTWRGGMPDGSSFYERYTLVNDSTFAVEAFTDATLASPRPIGSVVFRSGALYREESSGERVPATRLQSSGVLFGAPGRGFTWAPEPDGTWRAIIHWTDGSGPREVIYRMERFRAPATPADREAVRAAVLDYVEALYQIDPSRVERSVHPELAKRGFCCTADAPAYREMRMTYEELRSLASRWNRNGQADPRTAVKEIVVFDVLDQTATAKLTAQWGIDYLHLARYDGRWKIVNVLWQSPPK